MVVPGPDCPADIACRSTWEHRAGSQPLGQTQVCVGTCLYAKVLETGTSTALLNQLINVQYNVLFHLCKLPSLAKGWQSTHHSRADTEHTSLAPSLGVTQKPWMHLAARNPSLPRPGHHSACCLKKENPEVLQSLGIWLMLFLQDL